MRRGFRALIGACLKLHSVAVMALVVAAGLQPALTGATGNLWSIEVGSRSSAANTVPAVPQPPPAIIQETAGEENPSSDSVGATVSEFRVDESGGMHYTVPLYTPPGSAGFMPSLSLEYSSRTSQGPLGPGWGIGGLSNITLCRKGREYGDGNGPFAGINFDADETNQSWCVDGMRILDAGSAGSCPARSGYTGRAFTMELDQSTRICGYRQNGSTAMSYWLTFPKDGTLQRFGFTDDSRLAPNSSGGGALTGQVLNWALDRRVDAAGNSIDYSYVNDTANGEQLISEIRYTGHVNRSDPHTLTLDRATYNTVTFTYDNMPGFSPRIDWLAGSKVAQSKRLKKVTLNGTLNNGPAPDAAVVVRTYDLAYDELPNGSRSVILRTLKECAPNPAGGDVCYPPTHFDWSVSATQGFPSSPTSTTYSSSMNNLVDSKVGDVDGDGRQDVVWIQCMESNQSNQRFQLMFSLSNGTTLKAPVATGLYLGRTNPSGCATDLRSLYLSNLWHLYDFTGDGRDDLLYSDGTQWRIVPAKAGVGGTTFDTINTINTGIPSQPEDDGHLIDLDGDGLPDLLHVNAGDSAVRFLRRTTLTTGPAYVFQSTDVLVDVAIPSNPADLPPDFQYANASLSASLRRSSTAADINGDGASDIALRVKYVNKNVCPTCLVLPLAPASANPEEPNSLNRFYWFVYRNAGIQPNGKLKFIPDAQDTTIGLSTPAVEGKISNDGDDLWLTDINGDGQADLVYKRIGGNGRYYVYRLNQGKPDATAAGDSFGLEQSTLLNGLSVDDTRSVFLLDINGDNRRDLLYRTTSGSTADFRANLFAANGYSTDIGIGNSLLNSIYIQNNSRQLFADLDGDGAPDSLTYTPSGTKLYISKNVISNGGSDLMVSATNGLGATQAVEYAPITYSSVYERAYDGSGQTWGRGSPVFDMFASLWVVRRAYQSAPTALVPAASSFVTYRYAGARIQSGGRGFLGFAAVQTQDEQNFLVTTTTYRQDFPFVGRAAETQVVKVSGLLPDPCASNPNNPSCFPEPPDCGLNPCPRPEQTALTSWLDVPGQLLSDSANTWASVPVFNPSFPLPVTPYLANSTEQKFDLATPNLLSHAISSTFNVDVWGNLTNSTVISQREVNSVLTTDETKITSNVYGCTVSPPSVSGCAGGNLNQEQQRLGRLSISTVTTSRGGSSTTRRSSFEYASSTGQLIAEIQGPYTAAEVPNEDVRKSLGLRTDTVRDANGNPTLQVTCSTFHFANRTACIDLTGFQQQQWQTDPSKIQRYTRTQYESKGRFKLASVVPFYSASASNQTTEAFAELVGIDFAAGMPTGQGPIPPIVLTPADTLVVRRNQFGDPLNRVNSTGNLTLLEYGLLGRARFQEDATGAFSRTRLAWCVDVANNDIPAGYPRVNCPVGARYRVLLDSTGESGVFAGLSIAPTAWSYHDMLGREILKTARIYQQDTASLDRWSSVATSYDRTGRQDATTVPYFSVDPNGAQTTARAGTPRVGTPALASMTYDAIGRATQQTHPDSPANTPSATQMTYSALTTAVTDPRNHDTSTKVDARDDARSSTDALGLTVSYERDGIGKLTAVKRTPTDGDSMGQVITNAMSYDRHGRRVGIVDPDKGTWSFRFNALGEPTGHTDANGQTQTLIRDALGRLILRTETRLSSNGGYVSEPSSTWTWDTAVRPDSSPPTFLYGQLAEESNGLGGYQRTMAYDPIGRIIASTRTLDGVDWIERQSWDLVGRPDTHIDSSTDAGSTAGTTTHYSSDGYPVRVREAANNALYQEVLILTARGQVRQERYNNQARLTTLRTYESNSGRLLNINTGMNADGSLQNWDLGWDKNGNLLTRWQHSSGYDLQEDFSYDELDRLKTIDRRSGAMTVPTVTHTYDGLGNLMTQTGSPNWSYATSEMGCTRVAGTHAASRLGTTRYCYDANGNQTTAIHSGGNTRTINYTGYDLPETIAATGTPSAATIGFKYGPDRSMWKRTDGASTSSPGCPPTSDRIFCDGFDGTSPGSGGTTTYYAANVEIRQVGTTRTLKRHIGEFLVITSTQSGNNPPTGTTFNYLLRDGLGSIDVITNELGTVQQRMAFDAWGQRRTIAIGSGNLWDPLASSVAASFDVSITRQGYTGHEQLDTVGLVHMKGRLYDPVLHRFIQADPFAESHVTQGLNRYSYVLNNPLSATDPTGYLTDRQFFGISIAIVAAIFGQYYISQVSYAAAFAVAVGGGFTGAYVATGSLRAGLWGAFAAAITFGVGVAFSTGTEGSLVGSSLSSGEYAASIAVKGIVGGTLQELQGGNFGHGFAAAGVGAALSPAIGNIDSVPGRVVASAAIGGTVSQIAGGTFANGAVTGAFTQAFGEIAGANARTAAMDARAEAALTYNRNTALALDWEWKQEWSDSFINSAAGVGDSLSLGATRGLRQYLDIGGVDVGSQDYAVGYYGAMAPGVGRMAYSLGARGFSATGSFIGGEAGARFANGGRNFLRVMFRGFTSGYGTYPFSATAAKYGYDWEAVISAAGRSNMMYDQMGMIVGGGSAVNHAGTCLGPGC